jgi:hypothetical protein
MIKKKFFSLLIPVFLGAISSLQAEMVPLETAEHHLIHKVVENHEYCVSAFDGDKIFIRPENIVPTNQGLFVNLNGSDYFPLPLLQFNRSGHFIEGSFIHGIEKLATAKKEETKGPCPNCNVNTGKYGHCKNPGCEFYGLRVL